VKVYEVDWSKIKHWTDLQAILEASNDKIHITVSDDEQVSHIRHLLTLNHDYEPPKSTGDCAAPGCLVRMFGDQEYCGQHEIQKEVGLV